MYIDNMYLLYIVLEIRDWNIVNVTIYTMQGIIGFKSDSHRLTKCLMMILFVSLIRTAPTSRMTNPNCNTK